MYSLSYVDFAPLSVRPARTPVTPAFVILSVAKGLSGLSAVGLLNQIARHPRACHPERSEGSLWSFRVGPPNREGEIPQACQNAFTTALFVEPTASGPT